MVSEVIVKSKNTTIFIFVDNCVVRVYCYTYIALMNFYTDSYQPFIMDGEDWRKATGIGGKLAKHKHSIAHSMAVKMYVACLNQNSSVAAHLSQAYAEKVKKQEEKLNNRAILTIIIDIIRFLAKQNISFRGHRESEISSNRGNFIEMVHFVGKYNGDLQKWIDCHPRNVSWLSPDIQNEFINTMAAEVL